MTTWAYILRCADGSYYVGTAQQSLERRLAEHQDGTYRGYTFLRRPVELMWSQAFESATDAIAAERQLKGWRREKKEALIRGDYAKLPALSKRSKHPSKRVFSAPQNEAGEVLE